MLFNSLEFMLFFPIVTVLYFALPHAWRWCLLLVASCLFYMAFIPVYILILAVTIIIDYSAGLMLERATGKSRKGILVGSILSTIAVLFVFKYFNFFTTGFASLSGFFGNEYSPTIVNIILPIGLSFHTFQSLSYVIEVYRGNQRAERHFGIYALYVMFYPQLVAGPIERPQNLLHQFHARHSFEYQRVADGLKLMAWGMFKKVVIADRLSSYVNAVYANPENYGGLQLILATLFFAVQIYCDFSGYSDIAIGSAQVMGFKLMDNFKRPYFSKSVPEFWRRWHISLSTWFKDYVYIPLGGNKAPPVRRNLNLLLTFALSGLWHGANLSYVVWGLLNGCYLVLSNLTQGLRNKAADLVGLSKFPGLQRCFRVVLTFLLICFAWIFFRAKDLDSAFYIVGHLFADWNPGVLSGTSMDPSEALLSLLCVSILIIAHWFQRKGSVRRLLSQKPQALKSFLYAGLVVAVLFFGKYGNAEFIYFQF